MKKVNGIWEKPQLKDAIESKLSKYNKKLVDQVVEYGTLDPEKNSILLGIVQDLEEIKSICEKRGRY